MEKKNSLIRIPHRNLAGKELRSLCQQSITTREHSTLFVFTGSSVEIPESPAGQADLFYAIKPENFDTDFMHYSSHVCALPIEREIPESFAGKVLRICTYDVYPGYARLVGDKNGELLEKSIFQLPNLYLFNTPQDLSRLYGKKHGPANQSSIIEQLAHWGRQKNFKYNRECELYLLNYLKHDFFDMVFSVHCPYWPNEAAEWVTRARIYGFPCKSLINRVVKYGCHLVEISPKSVNEGDKNFYWRFSFSVAEYFIIQNWTTFQRIVYRTLRCLYKMILSKQGTSVLCTYFFKTLMLWECESRHPQTWNQDSSKLIVVELLNKMIDCLENRQCPNYFIPNNNMMDHLIPENIAIDLHSLRTYVTQDYLIIIDNVLQWSAYNEQYTQQAFHQMECPNWLNILFLLFQHNQQLSIQRNTFCNKKVSRETKIAVEKELYDIYLSLHFQREAAASSQIEEKGRYYFAAKHQLENATLLHEFSDQGFVDFSLNSIDLAQIRWLLRYFHRKDSFGVSRSSEEFKSNLHPKFRVRKERGKCNHVTKFNHTQKCLLYRRDSQASATPKIQALVPNLVTDKQPLTLYSVFHESRTRTIYDERIIPYFPGFPAVKVSWFIAKAFLANLVYVTEKRYSFVIEMCDEITDVYHSMFSHVVFADFLLPLFFSTQWAAVYDTDIQQLLGFYSLCSYIMNTKGCHEISVNVCAVHFSIYLKTRCAIDQKQVWNINRYMIQWIDHIKECAFDRNSTNARIVLLAILQSHSMNLA